MDDSNPYLTMARSGSKRRRLGRREESGTCPPGALLQLAFVHAISNALSNARRIATRRARSDEGRVPVGVEPELISLVNEKDALMLRGVAGIL